MDRAGLFGLAAILLIVCIAVFAILPKDSDLYDRMKDLGGALGGALTLVAAIVALLGVHKQIASNLSQTQKQIEAGERGVERQVMAMAEIQRREREAILADRHDEAGRIVGIIQRSAYGTAYMVLLQVTVADAVWDEADLHSRERMSATIASLPDAMTKSLTEINGLINSLPLDVARAIRPMHDVFVEQTVKIIFAISMAKELRGSFELRYPNLKEASKAMITASNQIRLK
jgi:hypothetical protein